MLPFVAGLAYEITKFAGKSDARIIRTIMYPGMMLQKLTTREPDDSQLEVAIRAFKAAAGDILVKEEGEESKESGTEAERSVDSRATVTAEPESGITQA